MLAGEPAPTGPACRGAKPPVLPVTTIDDPALPEVLVSTADSVYRQRGRARVTRWLLIGGEILHNRLAAAEQAAEAGPLSLPPAEKEKDCDR